MRGLTISAHGGLDEVQFRDDLPEPALQAPTDVRVRVQAVALNHLDLFVLAGLPGVTIVPPWVVAADAVGVVDEVGSAAVGVRVGDTVVVNPGISDRTCRYCREGDHPLCIHFGILGEHQPGTAAEYVVVPAFNVRSIPATTPVEQAAAFGLVTITAWRMLVTRARLQAGERVLIWGIGGGVATAALQICKLVGAEVWVTSSSDEKLERARALGADHVLNHRTADVARELRAATGKAGVDVVVDNVGAATWKQSMGALGRRGRLVTCGGTSGPIVETDVRRLFWNQISILGSTMGNDTEFDAIVGHLREGRLLPPVDRVYPIEQGREAYARLERGEQFGKIVLRVGQADGQAVGQSDSRAVGP
ncbi:MAG TPA: zinc-binding dehydrogenase [Gemmatimonadaceae bacterium]|nr:zinc-binding dehydrogenase [Gemmatimonadaceae bacterium]